MLAIACIGHRHMEKPDMLEINEWISGLAYIMDQEMKV